MAADQGEVITVARHKNRTDPTGAERDQDIVQESWELRSPAPVTRRNDRYERRRLGLVVKGRSYQAAGVLERLQELVDISSSPPVASVHEQLVRNDSRQVGRRQQGKEASAEVLPGLVRLKGTEINVRVE